MRGFLLFVPASASGLPGPVRCCSSNHRRGRGPNAAAANQQTQGRDHLSLAATQAVSRQEKTALKAHRTQAVPAAAVPPPAFRANTTYIGSLFPGFGEMSFAAGLVKFPAKWKYDPTIHT